MTVNTKKATGLTLWDALRKWTDPELQRALEYEQKVNRPLRRVRTPATVAAANRERVAEAAVLRDFFARFVAGELVANAYPDRVSPDRPSRIEQHQWSLAGANISCNWVQSEVTLARQFYVGVRVYRAEDFARLSAGQPDYSSNKARAACEDWLRDLASNGDKEMSKGKYKKVAREKFPGLSGRGFDRAWQNAVGDRDDWTRPGRKSQV